MKIGQIEKLCKSAKRITVTNDPAHRVQWIGDGSCLYPFFRLPKLTAESVFAIFDIPEEKQGKIFFEERDELPVKMEATETGDDDNLIFPEAGCVVHEGRTLALFKSSTGILCIDKKYLSPFDDSVTYHEYCRTNATPYIVVKEGLFVAGILFPAAPDERLGEWLVNVGEAICVSADNARKSVSGTTEID